MDKDKLVKMEILQKIDDIIRDEFDSRLIVMVMSYVLDKGVDNLKDVTEYDIYKLEGNELMTADFVQCLVRTGVRIAKECSIRDIAVYISEKCMECFYFYDQDKEKYGYVDAKNEMSNMALRVNKVKNLIDPEYSIFSWTIISSIIYHGVDDYGKKVKTTHSPFGSGVIKYGNEIVKHCTHEEIMAYIWYLNHYNILF